MKEFPNVSLVVMHSNMKINMDSNKRVHKQTNNKQTNKQTCMGIWIEDANHLISQNVHHINHNKDINKLSDRGLICMDFHKINEVAGAWFAWIFMLIVTGIVDFINVHWCQWHDQGSVSDGRPKCLHHRAAWHHILMMLMSWPAENKRHNSTQRNMFFINSSWPLVFILQLFNWDLIPYFEILPFPR